jgi:hypothetical protein
LVIVAVVGRATRTERGHWLTLACIPSFINATVTGGPPISPSSYNTPSTSHVETSGSIACSRPNRDASGLLIMAKTEKIDPVWDDLDR